MLQAMRVRVTGRVQGVGFRAFTRERARAAGLTGWVRNLPDGAVEAHLQGEAAAVASVLDWMRAGGPPSGRVDSLEVDPRPLDDGIDSFDVRR